MAAALSAQLQQIIGMLQQGQVAPAEQMLKQLNAGNPGHPDVLHLLAMAAKQRGDASRAEHYFRESLKAGPRQPAVHANLANLLSTLKGREKDAVAAYRNAVDLEPTFATGWHNLALMLSETEEHSAAFAAAEQFEKLTRGNAQSAELFHILHERAGEREKALAALKKVLKAEPGNTRLWVLLGNRSEEHTSELQSQ